MADDSLYDAVRSLLAGDNAHAATEFEDLRRDPANAAWARWGSFAALAGQGRWPEALEVLPEILEPPAPDVRQIVSYSPSVSPFVPTDWSLEGGGAAMVVGPMLRLVGLAGASAVVVRELPDANNRDGTWVEFVVRRGSSSSSDCRLEVSDGSVHETVIIDPGNVRLLSNGAAASWQTDHPHLYGLLIRGQTSQLFVDGQLLLSSTGLPGDPGRKLRFGVHSTGADSESHWYLIRATKLASTTERPTILPQPWPVWLWLRLVDELDRVHEIASALSLATQARIAHPSDAITQSQLADLVERASQRSELAGILRSTLDQLALSDRALIRRSQVVSDELLLLCAGIGVRFRRANSRSRTLVEVLRGEKGLPAPETFWAVRDVTFELHAGEMLGVIGRNGAGKSTLLHVIADLIEPNTGRVRAFGGRLLLSTGAAFLPGLTGRDNIFVSGLYLGMTRREISARFDEIVEFSELWDAIDRPLRTYSSGMTSRLQFALATVVDPEILLLDELLGAGDSAFTEKAHGRMHQLLRRARGVVVVTHDLHFVRTYCSKALVLERGEVIHNGAPEAAVVAYQDLLREKPKRAQREDGVN